MKITKLAIPDVMLLEPKVFSDERGLFFESFNMNLFKELTKTEVEFVQDNHSKSCQGVIRGLHYQLSPKAQGKLVRVIQGEIFDVAVDIRKDSDTFGHWVGEFLSEANKKQLWIPAGFAHGFLTLTENVEVLYKATDYYSPTHERVLCWNDKDIGIEWPIVNPILSSKDQQGHAFKELL